MIQFIYVITQFVSIFLSILQFLMMIRAILSWIPSDEDSHFYNFIMMVTEPVIMPVRMILDRFDFIRDFPIDISFFLAFVLLGALQIMLPVVV